MPTFALLLAFAAGTALGAGFSNVGYVQNNWSNPSVITTPIVALAGAPVVSATSSKALFLVSGDLEVARFRTDGTLDPNFGQQGKVSLPLKGQAIVAIAFSLRSGGLQYLGLSRAGMTEDFDILSIRLNSDGTPDLTYGKSGFSLFDLDFGSQETVIDGVPGRDDSFYMLGTSLLNDTTSQFLIKVTPNGSLDPFFGQSGIQQLNLPKGFSASKLFLYPDDSLMIVGSRTEKMVSRIVFHHYLPNGKPDTAFGDKGAVVAVLEPDSSETVSSTLITSDGKILVLGTSRAKDLTRPMVARFDAITGKPDPTLGGTGFTLIAPTPGKDFNYQAIAEDPNGGFLLAGNYSADRKITLALTRFLDDGNVDPAFGTAGTAELWIRGTTLGFSVSLFRSGSHWMVHSQAQKPKQPIGSLIARFSERGQLAARSDEE